MTESQPGYPARPLPEWEAWVEHFWTARRADDRGRVVNLDGAEKLRQLALVAIALPGEVGEALEHVKKHLRDDVIDEHALGLELGDALYCLTKLALLYGFTLGDLQQLARGKLQRRAALGKDPAGESDPAEIRAWADQVAIDDRVRTGEQTP
jgi:hypothetical protein